MERADDGGAGEGFMRRLGQPMWVKEPGGVPISPLANHRTLLRSESGAGRCGENMIAVLPLQFIYTTLIEGATTLELAAARAFSEIFLCVKNTRVSGFTVNVTTRPERCPRPFRHRLLGLSHLYCRPI